MTAEKDARAEWRERIGVSVMHAMTCAHDDEHFGPGAVCETCFANTQRIGALIEAEGAQERAEALEVAALLLRKVADYWGGRPHQPHGHHIYADLLDVLTGIERDAAHNRAYSPGSPAAVHPDQSSEPTTEAAAAEALLILGDPLTSTTTSNTSEPTTEGVGK